MTRRRLKPEDRRTELIDIGATLFAARPYDEVLMEDIAEQAGVSRALLYRYFPTKRDLFAAIYRQAADRLLSQSQLDPTQPLPETVAAGLDAHINYFATNRRTVLAANRALAGDPVVQAIIDEELLILRARMLDARGLTGHPRDLASAALHAWLVFVRVMCLEWLENETITREEVRETCLATLTAILGTN